MTEAGAPANPPDQPFWRPELDCLRFAAFAAVFAHHALPNEPWGLLGAGVVDHLKLVVAAVSRAGGLGVDLFFCLSAYLITEILRREYVATGRIDLLAFWARRSLRIWPLYFAFLLLTVTVVPMFLPGDSLPPRTLAAFLVFAGNWWCAFSGYPASVAAPLWSVSIEEQFYLAWPLLLAATRFRRVGWWILGGALLAVSWGTRVWLVNHGAAHPAIWCNTLARLDPIALGALLSLVLRGRLPILSAGARWGVAIAGAATLVATRALFELSGPSALLAYPLAAVGCISLLVAVLGSTVSRGAQWRMVAFLGRISYGLYVFHVLGINLVRKVSLPLWASVPLAFALTVLLALGSWFLLEAPFLRWKSRFSRAENSGRR